MKLKRYSNLSRVCTIKFKLRFINVQTFFYRRDSLISIHRHLNLITAVRSPKHVNNSSSTLYRAKISRAALSQELSPRDFSIRGNFSLLGAITHVFMLDHVTGFGDVRWFATERDWTDSMFLPAT